MIRTAILGLVMAVVPVGCVGQKLDAELMNIRQQAAANEKLYAVAALKYADAFQQLADQKHEFQAYLIEVEGDKWLEEHTRDGLVQASPDEFAEMLAKRDSRYQALEASRGAATQGVRDFRQMVNDKVAFTTAIYAKEVDAQKAKESAAAALDSVIKALGGAAGAAAVAIPLMVP